MLEGFRIIEIEGLGPGPFAGMHLADLGADVIVVHRKVSEGTPGKGERNLLDRGKRSIALDLKDPGDVGVLKVLLGRADGLIEGFRPGVMERLGLGPEDVRKVNPKLVYGRMTGWGQDGPKARQAGHDLNYISLSGALWYASAPGEVPVTPATLVGDIGGGALYLTVGILAGLLKAQKTGLGSVVDAAIVDGSAHMMTLLMSLAASGGLQETRGQSLLDGPHWSRSYRCEDGQCITVQCLEAKFYAEFLERMGLDKDPRFEAQYDPERWPVQTARLAEIFETQTRAHWAKVFEGSDGCVAPVLSPWEAGQDAHIKARDIWSEIDGRLQARAAPRFDGKTPDDPRPSPERGQDGDRIIAELKAEGLL